MKFILQNKNKDFGKRLISTVFLAIIFFFSFFSFISFILLIIPKETKATHDVTATYSQNHVWFLDDDCTGGGCPNLNQATGWGTGDAAADTSITNVPFPSNFRFRVGIEETANSPTQNLNFTPKLQFKANATNCQDASGWTDVPISTSCGSNALCQELSDNFTDDDATTQRFTGDTWLAGGDGIEGTGSPKEVTYSAKDQQAEWEWMLRVTTNASASTPYTLRVVYSNDNPLDSYAVCHSLTTASSITLNLEQNYYRWYENIDSTDVTTPWAGLGQNTPITVSNSPPASGDVLRIRISVQAIYSNLGAGTQAFDLQYAEMAGADCGNDDETWYDVGDIDSATIWRGYNNTPADGTTLTGSLKLTPSDVNESYEEQNPSVNNPNQINVNDDGEWDWVIQHNGASIGTNYCFQMVKDGGTELDDYQNYPKLITAVPQISQRAYIFENDDGANVNSNSDMAGANTEVDNIQKGQRLEARFQIDNTGAGDSGALNYKVQFDRQEKGGSTWENNWQDLLLGGGSETNSGGVFGDWMVSTVNTTDGNGKYTSIAIDPDNGFPAIAFYDSNNGNLEYVECNDPACSGDDETTQTIDSTNDVGQYASLTFDSSGDPIISYYDNTDANNVGLIVAKYVGSGGTGCDIGATWNCATVEALDNAGLDTSIAINPSTGYPAVSYTNNNLYLKYVECGNSTCSSSNSIYTIDAATTDSTSLAFGFDDNPVIAYEYNFSIYVAKYVGSGGTGCDIGATWNCVQISPAGSNLSPSIVIGADGYPVISYYEQMAPDLYVTKCNNATCSSNTDHLVDMGVSSDIIIGKDGYPVLSYHDDDNDTLKFVRCLSEDCNPEPSDLSGAYENIALIIDTTDDVGKYGSMTMGADGYPVISYYDNTGSNSKGLKVAKMYPVKELQPSWGVSGSNGTDITVGPAAGACYGSTTWQNGEWHEATGTSVSFDLAVSKCSELAFMIDTSEAVVGITYRLRLVYSNGVELYGYSNHPTFTVVSDESDTKRYSKEAVRMSGSCYNSSYVCTTVDSNPPQQQEKTAMAIGLDGNPVITYYSATILYDPKVIKCNDPACTGGDETITVLEGLAGAYPSIVIGTDGYPFIAFATTGWLTLIKCNDPACAGNDETVTSIQVGGSSTNPPGLAIGKDGYPAMAVYQGLNVKYIKCNDPACAGEDETEVIIDTTDYNATSVQLVILPTGNPAIAYNFYPQGDNYLKYATCTTPDCSSIVGPVIVDNPANYVGWYLSMAVSTDGTAIMSYYDRGDGTCDEDTECSLKVAKCNDYSCSSPTVTMVKNGYPTFYVGMYTSIAIGADGLPIISYQDYYDASLWLVKCNDIACSGQNETITKIDYLYSSNWVGYYSSLAIGKDGYPVIAHQYIVNDDPQVWNIRVTKGLGLPKTGPAYFENYIGTDRQLKFHQSTSNTWPQFAYDSPALEDGLQYWFDEDGYSDATSDDSDLDPITSSSSEAPMFLFIDKHSSNTVNPYASWIGQSTVGAGTRNIKLEIFRFGTTNSWEPVTTNNTCPPNEDCPISGELTSSVSEYYFARYDYDAQKGKKDTTAEYYTFWRIYQTTGSQTLKTDYWTAVVPTGVTVSGNMYENETPEKWDECDGETENVKISVEDGTTYTASCLSGDGSFEITEVEIPSADKLVSVYMSGEAEKGVSVALAKDTTSAISLNVYKDNIRIYSESGTSVTNADLATWDSGKDSDIPFTVTGSNLATSDSSKKIYINTGDTYAPGGDVSTGKLEIVGTYSGSTETLTLSASGTGTLRPLYKNGGTFNTPTNTKFTGSALSEVESETYTNLEISPGSGSPTFRLGTDSPQIITVNGNLTIGDAANAVTIDWDNYDPTLNIGGNIWLKDNTTWTKSGTSTLNFKPSGTKTWRDDNSTKQDIGIVSINNGSSTPKIQLPTETKASTIAVDTGHSLDLNHQNITITAGALTTSGTGIIDCAGSCNNGTVTILETGNLGGGSGTITFYNLNLGDNTETGTTTAASDFTVANVLTIAGGTNDHTFSAGSETITLSGSDTPFVVNGIFTASDSTIKYTGTSATNVTATTYNNLECVPASGSPEYTIGNDTLTINSNLTIGDGTNGVTLKADTNNPILAIGDATPAITTTFLIKNAAIFVAGSNNATLYGDMTIDDGGTYTKDSGTLIFDGGDGANPREFTDSNTVTAQNMGKVQIGSSPAVTNLNSDMVADSLTISAGDIFNTRGYDLDIATFITINGTLNATDDKAGNGSLINLGTDWTVGGSGIFTAHESDTLGTTVTFDETGASSVTPGGTEENYDFWDFQVAKSSSNTTTLAGVLHVENDLTIANSDSALDVSGTDYSINVGGSWSNSGTFVAQEGTVTFDAGSTTETIDSSSATLDDFFNIIFDDNTGSATFQLESTLDVNNDLTITDGTLDVKSGTNNTIYCAGNWDNNDTFTRQAGKVYFDAASGSKTITDGSSAFYDLEFTTSGSADWTYTDEGTASGSPTNSTTVQSGTVVFINARTGTATVNGGELNVDWYLGVHAVDAANTATDIDTGDADITISENSGTPASTVFRYNSGWGSGATSQTTGTDNTGKNPQIPTAGAIRIREYKKTSGSTTLYNYNLHIDWVTQGGTDYGEYDYYLDSGGEYVTSCLANTENCDDDGANSDDVIGALWHRETPGTMWGSKDYDGLNDPPDHGSWYIGMLAGLSFTINDTSIDFAELNFGNDFTDSANNTLTITSSATNGVIITAFETQEMTLIGNSNTIIDWTGDYSDPTPWAGDCMNNAQCGFGFTSSDTLVEGSNRYNGGLEYAGFPTATPASPIRVADVSDPVNEWAEIITYKVSVSTSQAAGNYLTTIIYVATAQY